MGKNELKVILIHGNSGANSTLFWFPQVKKSLEDLGVKVVAPDFPDNQIAHQSIWLPFLKNELKADDKTIMIGHSSGAVAALRYAEKNKIYGSVLVGVNYTDGGDATEKESGYYDDPWDWPKIRANQNWIIQFDSTDDPYIPIAEPRFIHDKLGTEYYEYKDKGHFMIPQFPELIGALKNKLQLGTNLETATFANGCFWCTEAVFKRLRGVESVLPGYSGGTLPNPTWEQVYGETTGHAESIQIKFDQKVISFEKVLQVFFATHDPTTLNQQGYDKGESYRSAIFYHDSKQKEIAEKVIAELAAQKKYKDPIVTEVTAFKNFYEAEDYHQNFYERGRRPDYCRIIIDPKIQKLIKEFSKDLK